MDLNKPIHLPAWFWAGLRRLAEVLGLGPKGPFDKQFESYSRVDRLRANKFYLLLHVPSFGFLFITMLGCLVPYSPRSGRPMGQFWGEAIINLMILAVVGFPLLGIGSIWFTLVGRLQYARYHCWLNLLLSSATFVGLLTIYAVGAFG